MAKYKITKLRASTLIGYPNESDDIDKFYVGQEFTDHSRPDFYRKIIAIHDNFKVKGYCSIVLADSEGKEKEFINVYNPSSVCGEIVGSYENS